MALPKSKDTKAMTAFRQGEVSFCSGYFLFGLFLDALYTDAHNDPERANSTKHDPQSLRGQAVRNHATSLK